MSIFRLFDLPEEIARMIFEMVVAEGASQRIRRSRAPHHYALISRTVKSWVEPALYRKTVLVTPVCQETFLRTINHHPTKQADFFAVHVRYLYLRYRGRGFSCNLDSIEAIVQACAGVNTLGFTLSASNGDSEQSIARLTVLLGASNASKVRVMVPISYFPGETASLSHPIFRNVSHLELAWDILSYEHRSMGWDDRSSPPPEDWKPPSRWSWAPLSDLPRLTHFCLNLQPCPYIQRVEHIMLDVGRWFPPWLRGFMVFIQACAGELEKYVELFTGSDMRVVVSLHEKYDTGGAWLGSNTVRHIAGNSTMRPEYWRSAENLIEKRRQGLVEWPPRWTETESQA